MLIHLNIVNFAIIKQLEIGLRPKFNILSGETGAGKSIIINAMNLLLGGRASVDLIRTGCDEASIEALFAFSENIMLSETLSESGFPFEGELLIKRTISHEGRNRVLINGQMATLQMLSRLGAILISISGQHEHQALLRPENHLYVLDDFSGLSDERLELGEIFAGHQSLKHKIDKLEKKIDEIADKQDLSRFQIQEIENAALNPDEDNILSEEKRRLQHAEDLMVAVKEGYQILYETNESILSSMSQCKKRIDKGAEIDSRLDPIRDSLAEIELRLEDTSLALRDFQQNINIDPHRLEEVLERLELLNRLKRKYGPSLEDVLKFKDRMSSSIYDVEEKKGNLALLIDKQRDLETKIMEMASSLSEKRKQAATTLETAVEKELHQLHMKDTIFSIEFEALDQDNTGQKKHTIEDIGPDGFDRIQFMICPNVGEELRPLSRIVSGGELSRIILALKTILARTASIETVIFDEVDSGISGATAEVVGEKLLSLADYHQILCITHLPQIACQGKNHFLVKKEIVGERTQTSITELKPEARVQEIARLLGGKQITPHAVARAREMVN